MYVYLRAAVRAVRGNTGVEKEETLLPPVTSPPGPASSRYLLSSYSIFTLPVPVVFLSPSTPRSSATRFTFPLSPPVYLSVSALPHTVPAPSLALTLSLLSVFLASSFIRDYASRIVYRSGADMLPPLRCSC